MNRQVVAVMAGALALAGVTAWAIGDDGERLGPLPAGERPPLALLTSLPLVFGESFGLSAGGSPALSRLEQRYHVMPIGVADAASLKGQKLLLMAHPRAQPAEVLVELDQWVRDGGRVLLLADPKLDWPSERAFGDRLRPPPAFADTGLLVHWGLRLVGPLQAGPALRSGGEREVLTSSPGKLEATGQCRAEVEEFIARCPIGKGSVTVIADADFINVEDEHALDGPIEDNLDLLIEELARLDSR